MKWAEEKWNQQEEIQATNEEKHFQKWKKISSIYLETLLKSQINILKKIINIQLDIKLGQLTE